MRYGEFYAPPPYGGGMPPPPHPAAMMPPPHGLPMMPGDPAAMMPPPPGFGDPVGFLLPNLFKAVGGLFGGRRRPPPPPPSVVGPATVAPPVAFGPGMLPPMPDMFYRDRPQFCRIYCAPMPGMMPGAGGGGTRRRRRRRRGSRLGEPVGAIPLIAALAPLAKQVLPGLLRGLTGGRGVNGYHGAPPPQPPPGYGYAGW